MPSSDRFYNLQLRDRPALLGDIGSAIRIAGLVISGNGADAILMLPEQEFVHGEIINPTVEEWSDFIRRSDDPEILTDPTRKIFHRKLWFAISGAVQQKVWAADKFKCVYCGAKMGDTLLTIDHFIPLERGGPNDISNYLTACRKCNKDKGNMAPEEWCQKIRYPQDQIEDYLRLREL